MFSRHHGHQRPMLPSNTVAFPLVHSFSIYRTGALLAEPRGDARAISEGLNKTSVFLHGRAIIRQFFGFVNEDVSGDPRKFPMHIISMAKAESRNPYNVQCGRRLVAARRAVGIPRRSEFAEKFDDDINADRIEKWENGDALVPPWFVCILKERWGITHDWIYDGDPSGLKHSLATAVLAAAS